MGYSLFAVCFAWLRRWWRKALDLALCYCWKRWRRLDWFRRQLPLVPSCLGHQLRRRGRSAADAPPGVGGQDWQWSVSARSDQFFCNFSVNLFKTEVHELVNSLISKEKSEFAIRLTQTIQFWGKIGEWEYLQQFNARWLHQVFTLFAWLLTVYLQHNKPSKADRMAKSK